MKEIQITKHNKHTLQREIDIHASLDHPNVIKLYEYEVTSEECIIIMELAEINLHHFIAHSNLHSNDLIVSLIAAICYGRHSERIELHSFTGGFAQRHQTIKCTNYIKL